MQLFYSPEIQPTSTTFTFDKDESRHIVKVLRKKENDTLYITNGLGHWFTCHITLATEKQCQVAIVENTYTAPRKTHVHIVVAPTKMNDRMEWFLEKATEIGVEEITPIICERSERKTINTDRFEKIIQAALKQSLQVHKPLLNDPIPFTQFINQPHIGQCFIAHCEPSEKTELKNQIQSTPRITLLIGPEGDFSNSEIQQALQNGYQPVSLGNTRLRTETAALVGCHTIRLMV